MDNELCSATSTRRRRGTSGVDRRVREYSLVTTRLSSLSTYSPVYDTCGRPRTVSESGRLYSFAPEAVEGKHELLHFVMSRWPLLSQPISSRRRRSHSSACAVIFSTRFLNSAKVGLRQSGVVVDCHQFTQTGKRISSTVLRLPWHGTLARRVEVGFDLNSSILI